jgi:hypothetical protein
LFEKIYDGEQILTVIAVTGENLQGHCCFRKAYYVRTVSQPNIDAMFEKYSNDRTRAGLVVLGLSQDGVCSLHRFV